MRAGSGQRAFTLIELLVVLAVVVLLVSLLLPALAGATLRAKTALCGARLQQLGIAATLYMGDYGGALPQTLVQNGPAGTQVCGMLFGGKKGQVPLYGLDTVGPEGRPLNSYVHAGATPADAEGVVAEMEAFRSPMDQGAGQLPLAGYERVASMYDLVGTSYALNDHDLNGPSFATLIPAGGGAVPPVTDPSRTWMIGSQTIYNYEQDMDREERWYSRTEERANLLFVDTHVRLTLPVPDVFCDVENTTSDYTFLLTPGRMSPP